jgi:hypothetical protein
MEYAHVAAQSDATPIGRRNRGARPSGSTFDELLDCARLRNQHAERFIS